MSRINWENRLEELDTGSESSADFIEQQTLQIILDAVSDYAPQSASSYQKWLLSVVRRVLGTHPVCARLIGLFNRILWSLDGLSAEEMNLQFLDGLQQWAGEIMLAEDALTHQAVSALASEETILAYSYTPIHRRALVSIAKANPQVSFICGEGRPDLEGHLAVLDLASVDAPVSITTDMALFEFLPRATVITIGTAAISAEGFLSRVGTHALLNQARELGVPTCILGTTLRAIPDEFPLERLLARGNPASVMVDTDTVKAVSPIESIVPLEAADMVLTEDGCFLPAQVASHLAEIELYPGLIGRPLL